MTVGQMDCTIVEGLRCCPFDRDLSEAPCGRIDAILLLARHTKVTDLYNALFSHQTVSRCQVPRMGKRKRKGQRGREM